MAALRVGSKCSHTTVYAPRSRRPRAPDGKLGIYDLLRAHRRSRLDGAAGSFIRDWPEAVHDPE
jgi:hypothetical protein